MAKLIETAQSWVDSENAIAASIEKNIPRFVGRAHDNMVEEAALRRLFASRVQRAVNEAMAVKPAKVNAELKLGLRFHVLRLMYRALEEHPTCTKLIRDDESEIENMARRGDRH